MHEIKFRAWDKEYQCMSGVFDLTSFSVTWYGKTSSKSLPFSEELAEQLDVLQYLGIKDINGVDVYDGSIYRNLDSNLVGKLQLVDGCGGSYVICTEYKDGRVYNHLPFLELDTTNFVVIGNIYENPELLESNNAGVTG